MKFSTLLILLPCASVALAAPNPQTTDTSTGVDAQCAADYCVPLGDDLLKCSEANKDPTSQAYLDCACSVASKNSYNKCISCFTDQSQVSAYTGKWDEMCSTYSSNDSSNKESTASSDKTCSWRMIGLAVAGGLVAAL